MGIEKFVVSRLNNRPAAMSTVSLLMQIAGNDSTGFKDNIFLNVLFKLLNWRQVLRLAMRAAIGSRNMNCLIHIFWFTPEPARMTGRSSTFLLPGAINIA